MIISKTPISSTTRRVLTGFTTLAAVVSFLAVPTVASAAPTDPPGAFSVSNLGSTLIAPYAAYRIPALSNLGGNVIIAAWDGRPTNAADSPNPNSIVTRRSTDGGSTWSAITTALAGNLDTANGGVGKYGYSDPSFVYDAVANKLFLFSVYSKNQGFGGSTFGNSDTDRNVISAQVSVSSDRGLTWGAPRLITSVVKPGATAAAPVAGDVRSMFATSGEGIQLRYGSNAGRLIQQFAGDVRQADGSNKIQAYSVYSDDHGVTWKRGSFVGTSMDENKVVELSDGRVMLNSRDNANQGFRKVAISSDGGASYGPVSQDLELPDPANNAAIVRLYPDAPANSPEAKVLLFTNANSQSSRANLTARVSCDDGASWPFARQINAGFSAYSTATRLGAGQIGVLYESSYSTGMQFARFDDSWLGYACDAFTPIAGASVAGFRNDVARNLAASPYAAGENVGYTFRVTNQSSGAVVVTPTAGNVSPLVAPATGNCRYLSLAARSSYACSTPTHTVTSAEATAGYFVPDTRWSIGGAASGSARVLGAPVVLRSGIQSGAATVAGVSISGARGDGARDLAAAPYAAGDSVAYRFTVTNTTASSVSVTPTAGNLAPFLPTAAGNCRYLTLLPGASYTCSTPTHTVTATEAALGYFVPDTSWTIGSGGVTTSSRVLGAAVRIG